VTTGDKPRAASLGTLFFTVFLDLLGFGLVIPFLPGLARDLGAGDFVATLPGAAYSLMQFLFIPVWGRLSDRVGRRPVLLWSIAASAVGMAMLGLGNSLAWLFVARLWSGVATANIAVAQAYIADVTTPETRARGMGLIGMAFGLGFIFGPAVGGALSRYPVPGLAQVGALPALVAAGLSTLNLLLALRTLPESLPPAARGRRVRRAVPLDLVAFRAAVQKNWDPGLTVQDGHGTFQDTSNWTVAGKSGFYAPVLATQNGDIFVIGTANVDGHEHVRVFEHLRLRGTAC